MPTIDPAQALAWFLQLYADFLVAFLATFLSVDIFRVRLGRRE